MINGELIVDNFAGGGGAYEIAYADGEGQVVFKGEDVAIELKD